MASPLLTYPPPVVVQDAIRRGDIQKLEIIRLLLNEALAATNVRLAELQAPKAVRDGGR